MEIHQHFFWHCPSFWLLQMPFCHSPSTFPCSIPPQPPARLPPPLGSQVSATLMDFCGGTRKRLARERAKNKAESIGPSLNSPPSSKFCPPYMKTVGNKSFSIECSDQRKKGR